MPLKYHNQKEVPKCKEELLDSQQCQVTLWYTVFVNFYLFWRQSLKMGGGGICL
ncbi:hypothetical protein ACRRTK_011388 [Alexandromys fortis]